MHLLGCTNPSFMHYIVWKVCDLGCSRTHKPSEMQGLVFCNSHVTSRWSVSAASLCFSCGVNLRPVPTSLCSSSSSRFAIRAGPLVIHNATNTRFHAHCLLKRLPASDHELMNHIYVMTVFVFRPDQAGLWNRVSEGFDVNVKYWQISNFCLV